MINRSIKDFYKKKNAEFLNVGGKELPAWISNVNDEYKAVKEHSGIIHRDDVRVVFISGEDRNRIVDKITTPGLGKTNLYSLENTVVCERDGKIVDMVTFYIFADGVVMICSSANANKVISLMEREKGNLNCDFTDLSGKSSVYTLIGPKSIEILKNMVGDGIESLEINKFSMESFEENEIIVSRSDRYGKCTFEVMIDPEIDVDFINAICKLNSNSEKIVPFGFIVFNLLRIEKKHPIIFNEALKGNYFENGLDYSTEDEHPSFIGKEALTQLKKEGSKKSLFLCSLSNTGNLKLGDPVYDEDGKNVGLVTSYAYSPALMKTLVLGFVENVMNIVGNEVYLKLRGSRRLSKAKIINPM